MYNYNRKQPVEYTKSVCSTRSPVVAELDILRAVVANLSGDLVLQLFASTLFFYPADGCSASFLLHSASDIA